MAAQLGRVLVCLVVLLVYYCAYFGQYQWRLQGDQTSCRQIGQLHLGFKLASQGLARDMSFEL